MFVSCNPINFEMEPKFSLSSLHTSLSATRIPFFPSHKSPFFEKSKFSVNSHLPFSKSHSKTSFWGNDLILHDKITNSSNLRKPHVWFEPIRAVVKRRKELSFDNVVQRDKKLRLILKIRKILVSQPDRVMSLRDLGKHKKELGLEQNRRVIALLRKFPAVFEVIEDGIFSLNFKLTPEAENNYLEELRYKNEMEDNLVIKLRKLLMMSLDKRILMEKITHLRTDLGLPLEYCDTICHRYPQFFKVVVTGRGPALELTHWDPELAVSAAELAEEENVARDIEEDNLITKRSSKFKRLKLPRGLKLTKSEMRRVSKFRDIPYISPYSDFTELKAGTPEKEKHACGVIHEMLSLTIEKRTLVDHLTHFREEFRFSQQFRGMLIRHPDMFYVSLKGEKDSIFLRDAYHGSQLIEKDKLLVFKEKLRVLVSVPRFPKRGGALRKDDDGGDGGGDDNGDNDDEGDGDDEWSDEDGDTPPDFDENGSGRENKHVNNLENDEDKVLFPVFPVGRPRECW